MAVVWVSGLMDIFVSPPPGEVFRGDGHAVVRIAANDVHVINATFEGVSLLSPSEVQGGIIAGNVFRGSRMSPQGDCYYGGGQAVMAGNLPGNPPKLVVGNRVEDYDCIAYSIYHHGPVHNIHFSQNSDDGSGLWSMLGPREDFNGLQVIGNRFGAPVRFGHGAFIPKATALLISGNLFEGVVTYMVDKSSEVTESANTYNKAKWGLDGVHVIRSRSRALCEPAPQRNSTLGN